MVEEKRARFNKMGQSLNKLAPGNEDRKMKEIVEVAERYYDGHFSDISKDWVFADFYRAVCEIVEEINKNLGNTQFRIPKETTLRQAYEKHHDRKPLTKEEFQRMLRDVIMGTGFSGGGGKDILFYIFGVPVTALFIKQRAIPKAVPNEIFIPAVTSATVLVLAKLNKI